MTERIINLDIYHRSVVILQSCNHVDAKTWLIEHNCPDLAEELESVDWLTTQAATLSDGRDVFVISQGKMETSILCHELCHAALKLMKIIGIDPVEAEEAYAYLFEYLVEAATYVSPGDAL